MPSHSKHRSASLLVQKTLPHFTHRVFLSKPLSPDFMGVDVGSGFGKLMAFLRHRGSHAVQPFTHLCGLATMALPSLKAKTPLGQYSTHFGAPYLAQPSHFSGKIVGYHGVQALAMTKPHHIACWHTHACMLSKSLTVMGYSDPLNVP